MPKGGKEDRMMHHIKESEVARGKSPKEAESMAWAHIKHPKPKPKSVMHRLADEAMKRAYK